MTVTVHVTHEAVHKVGGIGAVLTGLVTAAPYREATERTLLAGPLFDRHRVAPLGPDGTVLYDNWNNVWSEAVGTLLYEIEKRLGVRIVYGRRRFDCPDGSVVEPEVLLVDVEGSVPHGLAHFKFRLFESFGLTSDRYDSHWEYEQYIRLAEPAYEAVMALLGDRADTPVHIIAHEFMGLPTALKAKLVDDPGVFTVFYAHEVATARDLVDKLPGGDVAFYGALRAASGSGRYVEDVFGPQDAYFKHALVRQAWRCDAVFAVGDLILQELQFLGPEFEACEIDRVYNGVPVDGALAAGEREKARTRLGAVAEGLFGWTPDFVFTHVGRLVQSKGLWRDLLVLQALEKELAARGLSAVLIVLATEAGPRLAASIEQMRLEYDWPLVHREGFPDLTPGELSFDLEVRSFNAKARHCRALFINQFGFDARSTGGVGPAGVSFTDLRRGSDAELGLSTYEPFGIAQIEPLAYGALSVISDACGCLGFLQEVTAETAGPRIFVCGDYTDAGEEVPDDEAGWRVLNAASRRRRERQCSTEVASTLAAALPATDTARSELLEAGYAAAAAMSWDRVVETQYLPALRRMERRRQ